MQSCVIYKIINYFFSFWNVIIQNRLDKSMNRTLPYCHDICDASVHVYEPGTIIADVERNEVCPT